jgi:transposase-like protein
MTNERGVVVFMPKDVPKRKFSGEFKQKVVEELRSEGLSHFWNKPFTL